jgi:hypothetical protein
VFFIEKQGVGTGERKLGRANLEPFYDLVHLEVMIEQILQRLYFE